MTESLYVFITCPVVYPETGLIIEVFNMITGRFNYKANKEEFSRFTYPRGEWIKIPKQYQQFVVAVEYERVPMELDIIHKQWVEPKNVAILSFHRTWFKTIPIPDNEWSNVYSHYMLTNL